MMTSLQWIRQVMYLCCAATLLSVLYLSSYEKSQQHGERNATTSKIAFASFLSFQGFEGCYTASNFIDSAAKLGVSWKRATRGQIYDMVLLVVDAPCRHFYSIQRLRDIGWKIVWMETPIWYTPKSDERGWSWIAGNRYEHTSQFSKLFLWNLTQYEHILYMDSDILLNSNPMQHLRPLLLPSSYAQSHSLGMDHCKTQCDHTTTTPCDCNAGAMLITPSAYEFKRMLLHIPLVAFDRELQEQSFLQHYWTPQYNRTTFALPGSVITIPGENQSECTAGVHFFVGWKPWESTLIQNYPRLNEWWHSYCGYASCLSDIYSSPSPFGLLCKKKHG